jgi:transposase
VKLYENGKSRADIAREYDITPSALDRWIKNHRLLMENDNLKQAALIMGRK